MLPAVSLQLDRALLGFTVLIALTALGAVASVISLPAHGNFLTTVSNMVPAVITCVALWRTRHWLVAVRHERNDDLAVTAVHADAAWRGVAIGWPLASLLPVLAVFVPALERAGANAVQITLVPLFTLWLAVAFTRAVRAYLRNATGVLNGAGGEVRADVSARLRHWLTAVQVFSVLGVYFNMPPFMVLPALLLVPYVLIILAALATFVLIMSVKSVMALLPTTPGGVQRTAGTGAG